MKVEEICEMGCDSSTRLGGLIRANSDGNEWRSGSSNSYVLIIIILCLAISDVRLGDDMFLS